VNQRRSLVVRNARVLGAGAPSAAPLDLLIEDGRIREVGAPGMPAPEDAEDIDATDRLVIPGLVNSHTHAHGGLGKGA
jgi:5-methylthioadenosine/S-adenosylhomocysteine deaminase